MILTKVISGGQTGADQAGLEAAEKHGIPTGGYMPRGFTVKTADGKTISDPSTAERFGLQEHKTGYKARTWKNVESSDATIRLAYNFASPGEICTLNAIMYHGKLYLNVHLLKSQSPKVVAKWIVDNNIKILNVAGNSEHTKPGTFCAVFDFLDDVFGILKGFV